MSWLSDYPYRRRFDIAAGVGASTDFQYPVKVYAGDGVDGSEVIGGLTGSKVYVGGKCNLNFSNVAFTSHSGVELDFWQQPNALVAGVSSVFWVETPDATQPQMCYFYYGAGASKSNQANTFVDVISGVVGAWNMDEALATDPVIDYSGNGNNGVATGTTVVAGKYTGKNARLFVRAADDYITVAHNAVLNTIQDFSISFDFKLSSIDLNTVFILKGTANGMYSVWQRTTESFLLRYTVAAGTKAVETAVNQYVTDTWYHVDVTHNSTTGDTIIYKNGSAVAEAYDEAMAGELITNTNSLLIGKSTTAGTQVDGVIGNVIVYGGVVLSQTEVTNGNANYPDVSLLAGSVLVRKWATTTNPAHSSWSIEETKPAPPPKASARNRARLERQRRKTMYRRGVLEALIGYFEMKQKSRLQFN